MNTFTGFSFTIVVYGKIALWAAKGFVIAGPRVTTGKNLYLLRGGTVSSSYNTPMVYMHSEFP